MKIKNPTDFWAGVMFAAIGLVFATIAYGVKIGDTVLLAGYAMGTPARMGPAFFPFYLGVILTVIGVIIAIEGIKLEGKPVDKFYWDAILWVLGAVVLFGIMLKHAGMLLSGLMLVMVASIPSHDFKWRPILILAIFLVIFSALVFVFGLKLPIPLCPAIEALESMKLCRG